MPSDRSFNHTYFGNEDIEFQTLKYICEKCGKQLNFGCEYGPSLCKTCNLNTATACECHPPKRPKRESEDSAKNTDPENRIDRRKTVDGKPLDLTVYDLPDTCDMVAVKDIAGPCQIFGNYCQYSNSKLLARYGFIDRHCQSDTVSLAAQLFDDADPARQAFWETKGFMFLEQLKTYNSHYDEELKGILKREPCPPTGPDFIQWSLAIGLHGWVRFPLKVFTCLLLLTTEEWDHFIMQKTSKEKAQSFFHHMFFFEMRGDLMPPDSRAYSKWLELMNGALLKRQATYGEFPYFDDFQQEIRQLIADADSTVDPPPSELH